MKKVKQLIPILLSILILPIVGCGAQYVERAKKGDNDWPQVRRDGTRTAFSPVPIADRLGLEWRYKPKSPRGPETILWEIDSTPIASGDYVIVKENNQLTCLDIGSGVKIWDFKMGKRLWFPKISEGRVICAVQLEKVLSVEQERDVRRKYDQRHKESSYEFPVKAAMVCLDLGTGKKLWETKLPEKIDWLLVRDYCISGKDIILITNSGKRIRLDIKNGKLKASSKEPKGIHFIGPPVLDNENLYIAMGTDIWLTNTVLAIGLEDDAVRWKHEFGYSVMCVCVHNKKLITVPTQYQLEQSKEHAICCLDGNNGSLLWKHEPYYFPFANKGPYLWVEWNAFAISPVSNSLLFSTGETLLGKTEEETKPGFVCLDFSSGRTKWVKHNETSPISLYFFLSPVITGDIVFVPASGLLNVFFGYLFEGRRQVSTIYAYRVSTGEELYEMHVVAAPVLISAPSRSFIWHTLFCEDDVKRPGIECYCY